MAVLNTENKDWGFYGTIDTAAKQWPKLNADKAWVATFKVVSEHMDDASPEAVREYLDGRRGRHYANALIERINKDNPDYEAAAKATSEALAVSGKKYEELKGRFANLSAGKPAQAGGGRGRRNDAGMRSRGSATPSVKVVKR